MTHLLMNLRGVPDDEAEDVRALLASRDIEFFETPPGPFGITAGGIWLRDAAQLDDARALLDEYQQQRAARARAEHARRRQDGTATTLLGLIRARPLTSLAYLLVVALLLYFSVRPFFALEG